MIKPKEKYMNKKGQWGKWKKNGGEWKRMKEMKGKGEWNGAKGRERNESNEGEWKKRKELRVV